MAQSRRQLAPDRESETHATSDALCGAVNRPFVTRSGLEVSSGYAGINVGIILGPSDHNASQSFPGKIQQCANPVGRCREFRDDIADFFELGFPLLGRGLRKDDGMTELI